MGAKTFLPLLRLGYDPGGQGFEFHQKQEFSPLEGQPDRLLSPPSPLYNGTGAPNPG